jgi:polyisoprenyl-phosphate glycosyltransferase
MISPVGDWTGAVPAGLAVPSPDDAAAEGIIYSLVIPVYRNAESLPELLSETAEIAARLDGPMEAIFVVDGSPDASHQILSDLLPLWTVPSRLIRLSRNFGAFAAIRVGLARASGRFCAFMSADLQDPPDFAIRAFARLSAGTDDIIIGTREQRDDPWMTRLFAAAFWWAYRSFIIPDIPRGGVDIFACNRSVRDALCAFSEARTSLIGLLFWVGFRRGHVAYRRRPRPHGKSAWNFRRKFQYMLDSVYAFTDLPVFLLLCAGTFGVFASVAIAAVVLLAWSMGWIAVPGYTPVVLSISFFGALNLFGLGIVGTYVWRAYENTKARPHALVQSERRLGGDR